ncbi:radical SAM/SPASM domain-containing protein [Saccharicrinis sp. FJH62]|uniref:radical SAM/SPASM domain-containing protein n=1 Tax=Saccharicrinis sp. FJH62 TaxID=3344657 RepID=UPI0035D43646
MPLLKGYHKEVRALLGSLTAKRLSNLFLLYGSHGLSKLLKRNLHRGKPAYLTLETTNSCNLSCPECVTGMNGLKRATSWMSAGDAAKVIAQTKAHAIVANLYFQGEPLLNPDLFKIIAETSDAGIYSIISTNAQNLTPEKAEQLVENGLNKIVVSMDGLTQETYAKYRVRGKLQHVLDGIANLVEARKKYKSVFPLIEVQFIVFRFNEHEIPEARKKVYDLGVDRFFLKTAQFYDAERAKDWMPLESRYARYRSSDNSRIKNSAASGCKKMWTSMVVCSGGETALCCMDKNASFSPGKIQDGSTDRIWQGHKMRQFRQRVAEGEYLSICRNCPLKG